ncbi:MAG: winged helix-turn-helix transcriptional regulator [Thermoplasmatales archaeon]|nr:winged helix-turn-helix transcriptional regulator [Thermoplasmatales archaeon]
MISKENILKLETRREIYNIILENPGLHLREILRRTDLSYGVLSYHLNYLKKQDLIVTKINPRYTRYYVSQKVGDKDKEILNILREETPCKIILLLLIPGPGDIYQSRDIEMKAFSDLATHLYSKIYSKRELVELTRYWKGQYGNLFHLRKHRTTIGFHLDKLLEIGLIEKVKIGKEMKYRLKDENMIWRFLIRYKNALSNNSINRSLIWAEDGVDNIVDPLMEIVYDILPHPYHV